LFAKHLSVEKLSLGYMQAGASALSILTDKPFFGGTKEDLQTARRFNYCPILRKDFIIDEYQIVEAKSIGADVILLIAAALSPEKTRALATAAHALGLEVLLEVHSAEEIEAHVCSEVDLVGVNNRNLSTFSVSIDTSFELAERIPNQFTKISESGISTPDAIKQLKALGYRGFLIGEAFMSNPRPEMACRELIEAL
jgi:indole-3-glycerol phosphate synthase